MKKLLYILSGNLSTTPRALQSIKTAKKRYQVEVIFINRAKTWVEIDEKLLKELNVEGTSISIEKETTLKWFILSVFHKLINKLSIILKRHITLNAFANKATLFLYLALIKKSNCDLVIGHSYGSLYPAFVFSKKNNIPFAFDIEDYHPGEKCTLAEKKRREFLMQKLLPKAAYISYASPLIGKFSFDLIDISEQASSPTGRGREVRVLINNSFSQNEFQFTENRTNKIQMVWFSQNIAPGRGLELVIPTLSKFKDKVHLTLIGNLYKDFEESFLKDYLDFIDFQVPLPQKELNLYLCQFDVGLAIELSSADFNRDICLTNKIFAYTQAGLFVLATDTSAQMIFIKEHNNVIKSSFDSAQDDSHPERSRRETKEFMEIGQLTAQTTFDMEKKLEKIINNIETIRANKKSRFDYAKQLAWEVESEKLMEVWNNILKHP